MRVRRMASRDRPWLLYANLLAFGNMSLESKRRGHLGSGGEFA